MEFGMIAAVFALLLMILCGFPIAYAFGVTGFLITAIAGGNSSFHLGQAMSQMGGFALLALPLFIISGALMSEAGISDRLLRVVDRIFGQLRGGLGLVTILSCALFGAISGSAAAAIAAIGRIMIPRMIDDGYKPGYATALVACSSVLSLMIPPSIPMIVFAITSGISVGAAFLSTVIPGLILAFVYALLNMAFSGVAARQTNQKNYRSKQILRADHDAEQGRKQTDLIEASWALGLPLIVLGGIYSGIFTPTEAAAVAVVYALFVGWIIYRRLTLRSIASSVRDGVAMTGQIAIILFFLFVLTRSMSMEQIPQNIANTILGLSDNYIVVLLLLNVALLVIGMLVDDISGSILAAVVLMPIAIKAGINPVHFAAIVGVNLGLGNVSPPCAPLLFMAGGISNLHLPAYIGPSLKLLLTGHLPVVLLVTFIPQLALWLPNMLLN